MIDIVGAGMRIVNAEKIHEKLTSRKNILVGGPVGGATCAGTEFPRDLKP